VSLQQDVLRLQIPVHDALRVHVFDGAQQNHAQRARVGLGVGAPSHQPVEQLSAADQVQDQVVARIRGAVEVIEEPDDAGMVQGTEDGHLLAQLTVLFRGQARAFDDFDGKLSVRSETGSYPHRSEASRAQLNKKGGM